MFEILIKVTNLSNKRDSKTCMLSLQLEKIATLKCVRKHILDRVSSRKHFGGEVGVVVSRTVSPLFPLDVTEVLPYPPERGPMGSTPYTGPRLGDGPIFE